MHIIKEVADQSIAYRVGIQPGDSLVSVGGKEVTDKLDYMFMTSDPFYTIEIKKANGKTAVFDIENEDYEDLGLVFETSLMDSPKACKNKCVFCFIDQLPKGMRKTLYFKDDDSRLSFLQGNYITLTNLSEYDIDRIINLHISPVNVSVHTTNPKLRVQMLGNKNAGDVLSKMQRLSDAGIRMDTQIVLCKNINDGSELDRTISDLSKLYPAVSSLSVVPVGLTKFRDNLYPLSPFDKKSSEMVIEQINKWQNTCMSSFDTRFVYPADEFFVVSGMPIPGSQYYEGFPQLENGVGLIASFRDEVTDALSLSPKTNITKTVSIATGAAAYSVICGMADKLESAFPGLCIQVYEIKNTFFGESVTVAGLICGSDIEEQLKGKSLGSELFIPASMLRAETQVFLDDRTVSELETALGVKISPVINDGYEFVSKITGLTINFEGFDEI